MNKKPKHAKTVKDVLMVEKKSQRSLPNVPLPEDVLRTASDRRGFQIAGEKSGTIPSPSLSYHVGVRYMAEFPVQITCTDGQGKTKHFTASTIDISTSGILLKHLTAEQAELIQNTKKLRLRFKIPAGVMPEGYEGPVRIQAICRRVQHMDDNTCECGLEFKPSLSKYIHKYRSIGLSAISCFILIVLSLTVLIMRVDSFIYFRFNRLIYFYSIMTALYLLSRYFFGALYRPVPINRNFTPGVSIIIPCFNEEEWIQRTIISCINQDYPIDKLEVIIVDDCSNDQSYEKIAEIVDQLWSQDSLYQTKKRVSYMQMPQNAGKRDALCMGVRQAQHELVVFVDSDSFLDPLAIYNLVQPFQDPKMGGVTGRTDVANTYTNTLTKMQSVRYYIAFRVMKAAEAYFDTVTCLSGPISCYKKTIITDNMDAWLNQSFLGQKATFGDDRAMTNFVLRHYRTAYQDTAICSTIVPNRHVQFMKQQMRWKRSWLRESLIAGTFMWRKEPLAALSFYIGLIVPILSPVVALYNLVYIPLTRSVAPLTFLMGLLIMSLLMSVAQLFYRRSSTWGYGILFCWYYVFILLWQMPIAWVTFWKSTWGTRMTPADIEAEAKKQKRRAERRQRKEDRQKPKNQQHQEEDHCDKE